MRNMCFPSFWQDVPSDGTLFLRCDWLSVPSITPPGSLNASRHLNFWLRVIYLYHRAVNLMCCELIVLSSQNSVIIMCKDSPVVKSVRLEQCKTSLNILDYSFFFLSSGWWHVSFWFSMNIRPDMKRLHHLSRCRTQPDVKSLQNAKCSWRTCSAKIQDISGR